MMTRLNSFEQTCLQQTKLESAKLGGEELKYL